MYLIEYKEEKLRNQLFKCHRILQCVAMDFASLSHEYEITPMITRVSDRFSPNESGVHIHKRAFDARIDHNGESLYDDEQIDSIRDEINKRYPRADKYRTCVVHSFEGGPRHFHFQIPNRWTK